MREISQTQKDKSRLKFTHMKSERAGEGVNKRGRWDICVMKAEGELLGEGKGTSIKWRGGHDDMTGSRGRWGQRNDR